MGGSFLTTLAAFGNFGMVWPYTASFEISSIIPWEYVYLSCIVLTIPHYFWQKKVLLPMEELEASE